MTDISIHHPIDFLKSIRCPKCDAEFNTIAGYPVERILTVCGLMQSREFTSEKIRSSANLTLREEGNKFKLTMDYENYHYECVFAGNDSELTGELRDKMILCLAEAIITRVFEELKT